MTLSELMGILGAIAGAIILSYYGHSLFGWIGAIFGGVAGLVGGCIAGYNFNELLTCATVEAEKRDQRRGLRKHFGFYWRPSEEECWMNVKEEMSIGDRVTGKVVAKYYYGVFLDIGRGFPALLTKHYSDEAIRSREPGVGMRVDAELRGFDDKNRYFLLTQLKDEEK